MTTALALDVQLREVVGKKVKYLRQNGLLPATIYGKNFGPLSVQIDDRTFNDIYRQAGRTTLLEVKIPGSTKQSAFIQDVQRHPVTHTILHADLRVVNLREEMHAEIPITLVGHSPVIERGDAVANQILPSLEVRALPANIPAHIEIDVSVLDSLDKSIYVRDIPGNPDYVILTDGDEPVVSLTLIRTGIEQPAEEESASLEDVEPELIRKEREEHEEENS